MSDPTPSRWRALLQSPHHAVMALGTLGAGFATGEPFYFIAGASAYVLGWVYLPDTRFFRRWVEKRATAETSAAEAAELAQFKKRREALIGSLSPQFRERYDLLARVCRDIEKTAGENDDASQLNLSAETRLRKIDELMWMYLRLLTMQQSLEAFLETERREDLAGCVVEAEEEVRTLESGLQAITGPAADSKQRVLESRRDRLDTLRKRMERVQEAESNLELVLSEQERLEEQIKLIRADAVATKSASAVSARIDASAEHLNETNKWLAEMDQFRDLAGDLPMVPSRIGFEAGGSPPLPAAQPKQRARQSQ